MRGYRQTRKLKNNYCKWHCHCLLIGGITNNLFDGYMPKLSTDKKSPMKWYTIFLSVTCYIQRWKYRWSEVSKVLFFFLHALSVSKFICKSITDGLIDVPQITDKSLFDRLFLSMSLSVSFMLINLEYKYRKKISSINLKILVVFLHDGTYPKVLCDYFNSYSFCFP